MNEINITWESFKNEITSLDDSWVYRGQSDSGWKLETSLERYNSDPIIEQKLLDDFKKGFGLFNGIEIKYDLDYYAYMQHHGVPTKLLDFTHSPYVASYFAFEPNQTEEVSIYALNYKLINEYFKDEFNSKIVNSLSKSSYFQTIDELFRGNHWCLYFVSQFHTFDRQFTQQSIFLANCSYNHKTYELVNYCTSNINEETIRIYKLNGKERSKALMDLEKMNINGNSLFPGLDGFCRQIKIKNSINNGT